MYCSSEKIQTFSNLNVKCLNYKDFYAQREKNDGAKNKNRAVNKIRHIGIKNVLWLKILKT